MEPTTYGYSKFVGWSGMILFSGMLSLVLYIGISVHDTKIWFYLTAPLLLILGILIAFLRWCFIPLLNGAITLELDEEKLQCYLTRRTIYWEDVAEISEDHRIYSSYIKFEMVDGADDLIVPTKWIEGSTTSICNGMQEYFARTL